MTGPPDEPDSQVGGVSPDPTAGRIALPTPLSERYPDYCMPFVGQRALGLPEVAAAVEAFLVEYSYQTARAYRTDLEDIYDWATKRQLNFVRLTDDQLRQYQALLRRRKYSEGTIRRRRTAYRGFRRSLLGS